MRSFPLKIVTPDGVRFEGDALGLTVRTNTGEIGILAGHINFTAPLGMGRAVVRIEDRVRTAACIGGMVSVVDGRVTLVPTTFEWADHIDVSRAKRSEERAQATLSNKDASQTDLLLAEARLKRALVRQSVAGNRDVL